MPVDPQPVTPNPAAGQVATDGPAVEAKAHELPGQLSEIEEQVARHAWQYVVASRCEETGLFNSVLGYSHATMWDIASGLAAVVSAEKLELIGREEFLVQMRQILASLARMPLYNRELPNREYDIRNLTLLDARSRTSPRGSGWSALDLGRLLIWLKIVARWYPEMEDPVRALVDSWRFSRLIKDDELQGVMFSGSSEHLRQEGRLGYEQYAATGLSLWGFKLKKPFRYSNTESFHLFGVLLLRDKRSPAFLTSEPFFLARLEIGSVDSQFDRLGNDIYEAQRRRWVTEGILTAVSEDAVSQEPWFVYNSLFAKDQPWSCVGASGKEYPRLKSLSTKAAIAWWAIQDDEYSLRIFETVKDLVDPSYGYYAGWFERGGKNLSRNLNTNAVVLEAILYRHLGRRAFLEISSTELPGSSANTPSRLRSEGHAGTN